MDMDFRGGSFGDHMMGGGGGMMGRGGFNRGGYNKGGGNTGGGMGRGGNNCSQLGNLKNKNVPIFYNLFRLVRLLSNLDRMSCNFCPLVPPFRTKSGLSAHMLQAHGPWAPMEWIAMGRRC